MKKEFQDRIDEYILQRMSNDERLAFEKEIDNNQELQEQLTFTEDVQHAMKSRSEKLAKMKGWKEEELSRVPNHRKLYWLSGIAAVFVVGFFLNLYLTGENQDSSVDNISIREASSFSDIEQLLHLKKYEEALSQTQHISTLLTSDSVTIRQDSNLNEQTKEKKIQLIKEQREDLDWLKAHALIGLHRQEEALTILDELRSSSSSYQISADSLYHLVKNNRE